MNISNTEKINLLNDRLVCLATMEYNKLTGLDKLMAKSLSKHIEKYVNSFISMVMKNPEIIEILDKHANKN